MTDDTWLADRFEQQRPRLRALAYRMLGSVADADDAVQDAWLRLKRGDAAEIDNLGGWLTAVVTRLCLNVLRSRRAHPEDLFGVHLPDPIITPDPVARPSGGAAAPEQEAVLADAVGLALLVVLDSLAPAERIAFVLHDMFDLPFEQIGEMVGRAPAAARQLASRARRRVAGSELPGAERDRHRHRAVVDAFFAAAREGDLAGLARVLDPDVELHADLGGGRALTVVHGVAEVTRYARAPRGAVLHPALVGGAPGAVVTIDGRAFSVLAFTVVDGRIVRIDGIADPERVHGLAADVLAQEP
jgi:RNA polymerase sigma-70 factor (ECF subfamily)